MSFTWGSGHRPHVNDIELKHIADLLIKINARQYSIQAANVRHEHEYHVWEDVKLPEGKLLMPGVRSRATDLVEHPDLVAERLVRYANLVGWVGAWPPLGPPAGEETTMGPGVVGITVGSEAGLGSAVATSPAGMKAKEVIGYSR